MSDVNHDTGKVGCRYEEKMINGEKDGRIVARYRSKSKTFRLKSFGYDEALRQAVVWREEQKSKA